MDMKKKFFDKGLMVEGLSQLKLPGFIILIISVLGSVLPAIFVCVSYRNSYNQSVYAEPISNCIVDISSVSPIMLPVIYIAPFIFCFVLFSFLNNRKGSDYFHSIPATRVSLFLSFTVSIIIWLFAIVTLAVLGASLVYTIASMVFNPAFIPYLIFTFFAGALLVSACMMLAMSITGTVFTNIILFGLILFLPRFITTLAFETINRLNILPSDAGGLANVDYNIPVKFIYRYLIRTSSNAESYYTSVSAIVYSLIIAVIYIAAACLLFHYRKSETAGYSAPNKALQHVYRCVVTLPFALCVPITIIVTPHTQSNFWNSVGPTLITFIVISVLIYFLFELLTTKSFKKMIKSAPVLIIVVAVCAAFGLTVNAAKNSVLNFTPAASEIESVSLSPVTNNSMYSVYGIDIARNLWVDDDSLKSVVSQILSDNVKKLKSNRDIYTQNNYYVTFHMNNGSYIERSLFANDDQASEIKSWILSNSEYSKKLALLPPECSINVVSADAIYDKSSVNKLWESYKSEYAALSESDRQSIVEDFLSWYQYQFGSEYIGLIQINGAVGVKSYTYYYHITLKTPKTAAMYLELYNAKEKDRAKSLITEYAANSKIPIYGDIMLYNSSDSSLRSDDENPVTIASIDAQTSSANSKVTKCLNILLDQFDDPIDLTKPYIQVSIGSENHNYCYYQAISEDNAKAIYSLNLGIS